MISRVLLDTGPLVAILHALDFHHQECVEQLHEITAPLLTCWPVLVEAAWLLRKNPSAIQELLLSFNTGLLKLIPLEEAAMPWIATFLRRYRHIKPQIADAALIHLAERENLDVIFTLDRRDFSIYRLSGGRSLQILP